jgi:addiction module RelE/StbE family toxin
VDIVTSKQFDKKFSRLPKAIQLACIRRLEIFSNNPFDPQLRNHGLSGSFQKYRSINVTGDYRLIFEEVSRTSVLLLDIGTHHDLYGS